MLTAPTKGVDPWGPSLTHPAPPTPIPLWAPCFLLPKGSLSRRIFHQELFGSVLPALQDEPDVLPGFASIACFYDDLVSCSAEGGRGSAEGKQCPPLGQEHNGFSLQVLYLISDHRPGLAGRLKSSQSKHYK